jgi:outer membrane biosynthesis protein TonB
LNINIKIDAPELAGAIYALANALSGTKLQPLVNMEVAVAADPQPEVEKPKSERKQSEKVGQASEPPEPVKEEVPEAEQAPETPETEPQVIPSVVELRAAAQEKGKTQEGKAKIKALLNKFESKSISDVPEEYRASFLALLEAL